MKKKGFTLIELLAVIVLLAVISMIIIPVVSNLIADSKESAAINSAKFYIDAVEYAALNSEINKKILTDGLYTIQSNGSLCLRINVSGVCETGAVVVDFKGEAPKGGTITLVNGFVTDAKIEFEKNIIAIDNNNKLVEYEPICVLASDSTKTGVEIGAKYLCKVKDEMEQQYQNGYTFYVLSTNNINNEIITEETIDKNIKSVNLILERNINSDGSLATELITKETNPNKYNTVAWNAETIVGVEENTTLNGPLTAMNFLYNATKNWTKVEPINFSYVDGLYQDVTDPDARPDLFNFESINGVAKINGEEFTSTKLLRARMPIYSALLSGPMDKIIEKGEVADLKENKSNSFIYFNSLGGYWTFSSSRVGATSVWYVSGLSVQVEGMTEDTTIGVRPVITIDINDIE